MLSEVKIVRPFRDEFACKPLPQTFTEMVSITIGEGDRDLRDVTSGWLRTAIERLRHRGGLVCVKVSITIGAIDMILATSDCPGARVCQG